MNRNKIQQFIKITNAYKLDVQHWRKEIQSDQ